MSVADAMQRIPVWTWLIIVGAVMWLAREELFTLRIWIEKHNADRKDWR